MLPDDGSHGPGLDIKINQKSSGLSYHIVVM